LSLATLLRRRTPRAADYAFDFADRPPFRARPACLNTSGTTTDAHAVYAPDKENAIKFLQLLLGPAGISSLNENGLSPISLAQVSPPDLRKLLESLRPLITTN
jgi:hypothetical protein